MKRLAGISVPILGLAAGSALLLVIVVMLNGGVSARVLGIRIRVSDLARPLAVAALCSGFLIVRAGRGRRAGGTGRAARGIGLTLLTLTGLLALVAFAREAQAIPPAGDMAVIESYIFHALDGELLLGPYSRFRWHHPGPLYFFVLAPFYALSGYRTVGVAAAALAINLISLGALVWVSVRVARGSLAIALTALSVLYLARIDEVLASQWNPHVLILPALALIVMSAAVAAGSMGLLPLVAAIAAFIVQTHLGLAPTLAAVVAGSVVLATCGPWAPEEARARRRLWIVVNVSLGISFLLWFLPLLEQVTHTPGNLTKLWRFFLNNDRQPFAAAFSAWAAALSGLLRPDFEVGWGSGLAPRASVWGGLWAVAQVALLPVAAVLAARAGGSDLRGRFRCALPMLLFLASGASLWSVTRIAGEIVDHEVFWMSGLGVLNSAVIIDALLAAVWPRLGPLRPQIAGVACGALLVVAACLGIFQLSLAKDRSFRPGNDEVVADTLSQEIIKYARGEGMPKLLLQIDGQAWHIAAGVAVQLEKANVPFAVGEEAVWMFGEAVAQKGDELRTIAISATARHDELARQPGSMTIGARRSFFADLVAP